MNHLHYRIDFSFSFFFSSGKTETKKLVGATWTQRQFDIGPHSKPISLFFGLFIWTTRKSEPENSGRNKPYPTLRKKSNYYYKLCLLLKKYLKHISLALFLDPCRFMNRTSGIVLFETGKCEMTVFDREKSSRKRLFSEKETIVQDT